jgi:hypothetical protein
MIWEDERQQSIRGKDFLDAPILDDNKQQARPSAFMT